MTREDTPEPLNIDVQLNFAKHAFDNAQNLIARMDAKANAVLVVIGLLASSLFAALRRFQLNADTLTLDHNLIFALSLLFLLATTAVLWEVKNVFLARPDGADNSSNSPRLLFPLNVLATSERSSGKYYTHLIATTGDKVIRNYAQQIVANSLIFETKAKHVNQSIKAMFSASIIWLMEGITLLLVEFIPGDTNSLPKVFSLLFVASVGALGVYKIWNKGDS